MEPVELRELRELLEVNQLELLEDNQLRLLLFLGCRVSRKRQTLTTTKNTNGIINTELSSGKYLRLTNQGAKARKAMTERGRIMMTLSMGLPTTCIRGSAAFHKIMLTRIM
mmetsp:Transcript_25761/g.59804  ORF Transcript_25761/g.59804 Transcript_25761/m.59804 type:complete len:111 (+) Transcript_25761:372-704(+)